MNRSHRHAEIRAGARRYTDDGTPRTARRCWPGALPIARQSDWGAGGKDGVVLEQLDGKDLAARVGRAQHVPDVAVVAVGRLENKRHKPTLGVVLGAGVDRHGGIERVETDEFVARGGVGGIQGVPLSDMGCRAYTWAVRISVKYHDSHTAHVYR